MGLPINGALGPAATKEPKEPQEFAPKSGRLRHILTLLVLSAFVMANMNRQAYNQGLSRMKKRQPVASSSSSPPQPPLDGLLPPSDPDAIGAVGPPQSSEPGVEELLAANSSSSLSLAREGPPGEPSNERADHQTGGLDGGQEEGVVEGEGEEEEEEEEDGYDWTSDQVGLLQAAFSYGYTIFMIPGGRLSEIYGAKWIIFLSSFGSALCSLMTPLFASHSFSLLVASRVLMGLCQTGVSPAMYAFCSRWLPPDEASVYLPMIKVGVMVGFMLGSLLNGFLPWRTMFYVIGLAGLAWSAVWALFATSEPRDHKFISPEELAYIRQSLERRAADSSLEQRNLSKPTGQQQDDAKSGSPSSSSSAPWLGIITNPVVLAFTFTKFTVKLSTDTQSMQIPMYLKQVFNVSDGLNGFLNGANFAIQAVCTGFVAYTAKEMVVGKKFGLNKTGVRILFQSINNFGMGLAYLLISFNMGSLQLVCGAVIILCSASMFGAGGEAVLPIDLTTEYSASIMAIANSAANLSGIVLPPIVAYFLANEFQNAQHWNKVWWFISSTMICGGLMFACFVQAKIQDFSRNSRAREVGQKLVAVAPPANGLATATVVQMAPDTSGNNGAKDTTRL